jgi:hypothetical protein
MLESFRVTLSFSRTVVLERKIFNETTLILHFCNKLPFVEKPALYLKEKT